MIVLNISSLIYGALFSYPSHPEPSNEIMKEAKNITLALKNERMVRSNDKTLPMSEAVAEILDRYLMDIPFSDFFEGAALVPIPGHAPMRPGSLWVPERIGQAMLKKGIGTSVVPCLVRTTPVNKSAFSPPADRPTAQKHYDSLTVKDTLNNFDKVVLVDDVVTRGATFMGATNKIADSFPDIQILSFAAMRAITAPSDFEDLYKPVKGEITLLQTGDTIRSP